MAENSKNVEDLSESKVSRESKYDKIAGEDDSDRTSASLSASSSRSSSPLPHDNSGPIFRVKFACAKQESGSLPCLFTIEVQRLDNPELKGKTWKVTRSYADFEKFDQSLSESLKSNGIIFPPLPEQPHEKDLLYDSSEYFLLLQRQLEKYLQIICSHHVLGSCHLLAEFLSTSYVSISERIARKGFFAKFTESLEIRKPPHSTHKDLDEFFHHERDWLASYSELIQETINATAAAISAQRKISGQTKHLCSVLTMNASRHNSSSDQLHFVAAQSFLSIKDFNDRHIENNLQNLYSNLSFYGRYLQNEQSMLNRRTNLMIDYEIANRNWDKAKLARKEEAEVAKKEAEQAFEDCSETARHEIRLFHKQRVMDMKQALVNFARNELRTARDLKKTFLDTVNQLEQISC